MKMQHFDLNYWHFWVEHITMMHIKTNQKEYQSLARKEKKSIRTKYFPTNKNENVKSNKTMKKKDNFVIN